MYGPEFAEIYDLVYTLRGKDYPAESAYVAGLIRERVPGASSILDVACGTGGHLRHFLGMFDRAEGVELSDAMLAVARDRLPEARLHHGDMRDFDLGRAYDAVVCLFAAVAHQDPAELGGTMRCFARHLRPAAWSSSNRGGSPRRSPTGTWPPTCCGPTTAPSPGSPTPPARATPPGWTCTTWSPTPRPGRGTSPSPTSTSSSRARCTSGPCATRGSRPSSSKDPSPAVACSSA
ncbi:class I SAM-dependent DNA methyltransferase [Streptomyces zhihengii]